MSVREPIKPFEVDPGKVDLRIDDSDGQLPAPNEPELRPRRSWLGRFAVAAVADEPAQAKKTEKTPLPGLTVSKEVTHILGPLDEHGRRWRLLRRAAQAPPISTSPPARLAPIQAVDSAGCSMATVGAATGGWTGRV